MNWTKRLKQSVMAMSLTALAGTAAADIAIVVNPSMPDIEVDELLLKDLFLGKTSRLPGTKSLLVVDQEPGPVRDEFLQNLIQKPDSQVRAYWAQLVFTGRGQPPKRVMDDDEVKLLVSDNPSVLGYIDVGSVDASVKVLYTVEDK